MATPTCCLYAVWHQKTPREFTAVVADVLISAQCVSEGTYFAQGLWRYQLVFSSDAVRRDAGVIMLTKVTVFFVIKLMLFVIKK